MEKIAAEEYVKLYGDWEDENIEDVAFFYISDKDECPYIGVEYKDGEVWVYGARVDHKVEDGDELEWYLSQE